MSNTELKAQTVQPAPRQDLSAGKNSQDTSFKSNKRKRNNGADDKVTKSNVDEMWKRHIEGTKPRRDRKKKNTKRKEKGEDDLNTSPGDEKTTDDNDKSPSETTEAPRKKRKASKSTPNVSTKVETQTSIATPPSATPSNLTPLQKAMRDKLVSARFRHLNETLYTSPSTQALELFTANPELFGEYHAGFSRQVKESWPSNPVDDYIRAVKTRGPVRPPPKGRKISENSGTPTSLPRRPNGLCTIADLGCGDAQFARALAPFSRKMKLKLLNYDLHEGDPLITKADISSLPLEDGTVDVTIFCLSLMGTNWVSFVEEAWRVLRGDGKGECWVSEVKSRFGKVTRKGNKQNVKPAAGNKNKLKKKRKAADDDEEEDAEEEIFAEDTHASRNDDDETDISALVEVFRTRGFVLKPQSVDKSNKMFVRMEFVKHGQPVKGKYAGSNIVGKGPKKKFLEPADNGLTPEEESKVLKPCVYKIR